MQRWGFSIIERFARRILRQWAVSATIGAATIQAAIRAVYHRRRGLVVSFLLHLAAWVAAAVEAWLALRLMGAPLGFGAVLVVESLLYAIRSVAFAVPNALGVQEGAYILLGGMFVAVTLFLPRGIVGTYNHFMERRRDKAAAAASADATSAAAEDGMDAAPAPQPRPAE